MASIKSIILLLLYIVLGMGILVVGQKLSLPVHAALPILILFLLLNIRINKFFKLNAIKEYWSLRKFWCFIPAIIAGTAIALAPLGLSLLTGVNTMADVTVDVSISATSLLITFLIVCWEELWFRGIILNYCVRHLSPIILSVIVGVLFVLLHVFNPEIDLVRNGPVLFAAGALLTILYLYYKTIWVPLGVHFGNNYFGNMVTTISDDHMFFGKDGYCGALVLLLLFIFYAAKYRKSAHGTNESA